MIYLFGELIISSALQGQVLLNNKPVSGAVVTRDCHWGWSDEKFSHKTITDADGNFKFPEIVGKSFFATWLPHEPVIQIDVLIQYQGKSHKAFLTNKRNYKRNGEFKNDVRYTLVCHLEKEPSRDDQHDCYGICELVPI